MSADDIVRELMTGDRDLIEDADSVGETGTLGIEVRHTDDTGASVILRSDIALAWRSDSESEDPTEFDIWNADIEPVREIADSAAPSWLTKLHENQVGET